MGEPAVDLAGLNAMIDAHIAEEQEMGRDVLERLTFANERMS